MTSYVRNNAWNNGGNFTNPALLWYARGVQKMMSRPLNDQASWWFFAAIHGEYVNPNTPWYVDPPSFPDWGFIQGPPSVPTSPMPNQGVQDLFWNQCQHGSWYFLPWHRGYLMALEAQLRADIASLGGPADWALPYWDYFGATPTNQYGMPPAFGEKTLDGAPNPLFVQMRYGPDATGNVYVPTPAWQAAHPADPTAYGDVTATCLQNDIYTGSSSRTPLPGFGGPVTGFEHSGNDAHGNLESNPHDLTHVYVGGQISNSDYGLMSDPGTAALDPIFYLHHCNIDRMWALWNANGNANPTSADWLNGPARQFVMPWTDGKPWYYTPMQVTNLKELNYTYQELEARAPRGPNLLEERLTRLGAFEAVKRANIGLTTKVLSKPPELMGASKGSIQIEGAGAHAVAVRMDVGVRRKVADSFAMVAHAVLPDRVHLKLENVRGTLDATVLGVYINLSDDATPQERRESLVGEVGLFGLRRASVPDGEHGGGGLSFVLDITRFIDQMYVNQAFDIGSIQVSLLPRRPLPDAARITVGRISVYHQGH